jgi:acetylornithine/succinyldiaminopimelate/putrescine aminotransferase
MTPETTLPPAAPTRAVSGQLQLPLIRSSHVLSGLAAETVNTQEIAHGNGDLIEVLRILGIGGPFKVESPWELRDETGRHLINAGGYAALPFGEKYPPLISFMKQYLERSAAMGLPQQSASDWRAALESNLIMILSSYAPSHHDSQVFFSNSGAEAIEAAIKFAKAARPKARTILNFTRGYHGKTLGALSLTPNPEYQDPFRPLMPGVTTLPYGDAEVLKRAVRELDPDTIVAIVVEPIQGEGGVITPPQDFLPTLHQICQQHGIISIADEIQSGLGRSGHWFASLAMGLEPDIMTLAKPLGGGMVPIGATIARRPIIKKTLGGLESKRHSNTFGGGSLAMAVGLRSLEIIIDEGLVERAALLGERGRTKLLALRDRYPNYIKAVRVAGMLFAIQLRHVVKPWLIPGQRELIRQLGTGLAMRAMHLHGLHVCFTLNASQTFRLTPALTIPEELFDEMFVRLGSAAESYGSAFMMLPKTSLSRLIKLAKLALG